MFTKIFAAQKCVGYVWATLYCVPKWYRTRLHSLLWQKFCNKGEGNTLCDSKNCNRTHSTTAFSEKMTAVSQRIANTTCFAKDEGHRHASRKRVTSVLRRPSRETWYEFRQRGEQQAFCETRMFNDTLFRGEYPQRKYFRLLVRSCSIGWANWRAKRSASWVLLFVF